MTNRSRLWLPLVAALAACSTQDAAGPRAVLPTEPAADATTAATTLVRTFGTWQVTMTDLGEITLGGGSSAYAINELGEVVGTAINASGVQVRPIWVGGVRVANLGGTSGLPYAWNNARATVGANIVNSKAGCSVYWLPGLSSGQLPPVTGGLSCATTAYDVNASGEMSGGSSGAYPVPMHPVTWKNGLIFRDLPLPPGARNAWATGINDAGDLVGNLTDAVTGQQHGFVLRGGVYTRLTPLPGPYWTEAIDINNRGDIVGKSNGGYPVVWPAGTNAPSLLPIPTGHYPHQIWRINDNGDVVGSVNTPPPTVYVATLWRNRQYISLGTWTGGQESYARSINSSGTIAGVSTFNAGTAWGMHAMTWTVTPSGGGTPPNTPPAVTLVPTSPTTIGPNGTVSMAATFTDPDAADGPWSYTWKWGNGPVTGTWAAPGTYSASRQYIKGGASYTVMVIVTDKRGAADTSNVVRVTVQ